MESGTVKRLMDRGYGFIAPESGDDLFFHFSDMAEGTEFDSLGEGDQVQYEMGTGQRGPKAVNISKVG